MKFLIFCLSALILVSSSSWALVPVDSSKVVQDTADSPIGLQFGRGGVRFDANLGFVASTPALELSYGVANFQTKSVDDPVQGFGVINIALGSFVQKRLVATSLIKRAEHDRLYVQLYDPHYSGSKDSTMTQLSGWRIGYHLTSGYSYMKDSSNASFTLLHTGGPVWSFNTFKYTAPRGADSSSKVVFDDLGTYRFGSHTGAAVRIHMTSALALQLDLERTMMFDNYSFFSWVGSIVTEGLAQAILGGNVIQSIERKSPLSVPVANVVLRSVLSYGIYELRRTHQHFPFGGNAPMISDAIRIGLVVTF